MPKQLEIGERASDFTLQDERGETVTLSRVLERQNVMLVFYPGDDTPGCTTQLCAVRDDQAEFDRLDCVVLGVNHAPADSHQKFIEKYGLTTHLLIDPDRRVSDRYAATKKFFGHPTINRTVVVIDRQGIIRYYKHGLPPNEEMLVVLRQIEKKPINASP